MLTIWYITDVTRANGEDVNGAPIQGERSTGDLEGGKIFAYKLVQSGEIRAVRVGRCLRVRATDLEEYIAAL
jgi:excisionase family DNA binding protein